LERIHHNKKLHVNGAARVTGGYYDSSNSSGTTGQVLSSNGSSTSWIDGSAIPGTLSGSGIANSVPRFTSSDTLGNGAIQDNGSVISVGTVPGTNVVTVNSGLGVGSNGLFVKDPFAGTSRVVSSNNPILSLGTSTSNGATAAIYLGKSENQESKIE